MKRIQVLQHIERETLGAWEEELTRWHVPFTVVRLWEGAPLPTVKETLAAIVLGGPMNVSEQDRHPFLAPEIAYLRQLLDADLHVLGVCLGAQLIAAAMGAEVGPGPIVEIGYTQVTLTPTGAEDTLLSGFPMALPVFQWHSQGCALPEGATLLARTAAYPVQAFRRGKVWGFQFHLEVNTELVKRWAEENPEDLKAVPGLTRDKLLEDAAAQGQMIALFGRQIMRRFWDSIAEV